MSNILDNIKHTYNRGDVLMKFIFINIGVFFAIHAVGVVATLFRLEALNPLPFLAVPSQMSTLLVRFWTLLTYMFVHVGFMHILFNMLWLYWFGRIFQSYFNDRTLGSLYVIGGLAGALLYIIAFNTIPYYIYEAGHGVMIGASASVMAIVMAAAFYRPEVTLNLFLFGRVKIIYIALIVFVIDFFSLSSASNPGGHVAHIGGAIAGYLFAVQYKKGKDFTLPISRFLDMIANLFKKRKYKGAHKVVYKKPETDYDYNYRKAQESKKIDAILEKLKQSGYSSLSSEEKRQLFDASKK
ncbi:MAG TPA: rhomboid family intramembrane serine protease [Dysgonamonadaceae bacterium]|nr:rhomboid family intramembrane serine protease [Dysgonamonadaceae bacterium]